MWPRRRKLLWAQPQRGQVAELMMTVAKSRDRLWDNKSMDHSVTNPQQAPPIGQLHLGPLYLPCQLWRPCLPWNQGQGSHLSIQDLQGQTFPPLWDNIPHPHLSPQTRSDQWLNSFLSAIYCQGLQSRFDLVVSWQFSGTSELHAQHNTPDGVFVSL